MPWVAMPHAYLPQVRAERKREDAYQHTSTQTYPTHAALTRGVPGASVSLKRATWHTPSCIHPATASASNARMAYCCWAPAVAPVLPASTLLSVVAIVVLLGPLKSRGPQASVTVPLVVLLLLVEVLLVACNSRRLAVTAGLGALAALVLLLVVVVLLLILVPLMAVELPHVLLPHEMLALVLKRKREEGSMRLPVSARLCVPQI